jgi:Pentapeptide repeats (8 copies)
MTRTLVAVAAAALCFGTISLAAGAPAPATTATVTIEGAPANGLIPFAPLTLTTAQLGALPQQTLTVAIGGVMTTETGPTVASLLALAGFKVISACRNDFLRYWVEASSLDGSAAEITDAELDPSFGNRPAILSLAENGAPLRAPRLVVQRDATGARYVRDVFDITVGRADLQLPSTNAACNPRSFTPPVTAPPKGSVLINGAVAGPTTLTFAQLQALPQVTQTDTFLSGTNPTTRTETGPTLISVLDAAGGPTFGSAPDDKLRFYVEATSSEDGAPAMVSWAEVDPALDANQVLLSLVENGNSVLNTDTGPRLTSPGDVRGARYDFGVQVITVFRAPDVTPPPAGSGLNLAGQNLKNALLANAYLVGSNLAGTNLNGGHLAGALLVNASLAGANLNNADLSGALLNGADLAGANLHGADLSGADLTGANLTGANLNGANLEGAISPP